MKKQQHETKHRDLNWLQVSQEHDKAAKKMASWLQRMCSAQKKDSNGPLLSAVVRLQPAYWVHFWTSGQYVGETQRMRRGKPGGGKV